MEQVAINDHTSENGTKHTEEQTPIRKVNQSFKHQYPDSNQGLIHMSKHKPNQTIDLRRLNFSQGRNESNHPISDNILNHFGRK